MKKYFLAARPALGWLALAALLAHAAGRWLSFAPPALGEAEAAALADNVLELKRGGETAEALRRAERLLRSFPENPSYLEQEAELYGLMGNARREAQAWELFLQYATSAGPACPALERAYDKLGESGRALDAARRCVEREPANCDFHYFYAAGLEDAGRYDEARRHFEKVLEIAPSYAGAAARLARLKKVRGGGTK